MPIITASTSTNGNNAANLTSITPTVSTAKYEIEEEYQGYKTTMKLKIHSLSNEDFGSFKCLAKNTLGEKEGLIRVYGKCTAPMTSATTIHN